MGAETGMNLIALKMLTGDRLRYVSLVAGLAFAAMLVTQQLSIFSGFSLQMGVWIRETAVADLWCMDEQVNFTDDFKPVPQTRLSRIRGIAGVAWATPMYKGYMPVQLSDGTLVLCRIIGLDDATLLGAPPQMVQGKVDDLRRDKAVFINTRQAASTLSKTRSGGVPLKMGDRISINDHDAVVAGTYSASREFFWDPVIYTTFSRAISWAPPQRKMLTYVLVKAKPGQDVNELAQRIEATTGLGVYTNDQMDRKTTGDLLARTGILVNFGITTALGFVIGVLISGQTFYMFIIDNLRYFAVLKALGTTNGRIVRMVFVQTACVGLIGYGIGAGAASIAGLLFGRIGLAFQMPWQVPVVSAFAIIVCCGGAALLSLTRVMRLEAGIVFRN